MTFQPPDQAFEQAIYERRLSRDPKDDNYAGNYMYMGTPESGRDLFKNIETRRYDV